MKAQQTANLRVCKEYFHLLSSEIQLMETFFKTFFYYLFSCYL